MITGILYSHARPDVAPFVLQCIRDAAKYSRANIIGVFDWEAPELGEFTRIYKPQATDNPHRDIYERIIAGCEASKTQEVALLEHDVLYPIKYFTAANIGAKAHMLAYNRMCASFNGQGYFWRRPPMSNCIGDRDYIIELCLDRLDEIDAGRRIVWAELGGDTLQSTVPKYVNHVTVDLRLGGNLTGARSAPAYMDRIGEWPTTRELLECLAR